MSSEAVAGGALTDQSVGAQLGANEERIRQLQTLVSQKEIELRVAKKAEGLLRENEAIDRLTLRKLDAGPDPASRRNRMPISRENLDRVVELENAIKLESLRSEALKKELGLLERDLQVTDVAIDDRRALLEAGQQLGPLLALKNAHDEKTKALEELRQEQLMLKQQAEARMKTIQQLTAQLDARRQVEEHLAHAEELLEAKTVEVNDKVAQLKQLERIMARKEKLLKTMKAEDDYKTMRKLEGDKRTLHTDLSKQAELLRTNEKALAANEHRLRQLVAQMDVLAAALTSLFDGKPDRQEHQPEGSDGQIVNEEEFNALCGEIVVLRRALKARDEKLEEEDAAIEALEARLDTVRVAQISQTVKATLKLQEMEKKKLQVQEHMAKIGGTFLEEKARLDSERVKLQRQLLTGAH